jgi:DNA-binding NarL/FixJ family response regulator
MNMTHQLVNTIGIYVAEEQELYRNIYQASFETDPSFRFIGVNSNGNEQVLMEALVSEKPDVLVMGTRKLRDHLYLEIESICSEHPRLGLVILLTSVSEEDQKMLRKLIQKRHRGIGMYLKQSLDSPRQLHDIIRSVSHGQIVLDPAITSSLLVEKIQSPFIQQLTDREMEVLNLLSQGHTNHGIAKNLCIDIKTVAHHLNNIYGKLKDDTELNQKHPRVSVARLYLETTGELIPARVN